MTHFKNFISSFRKLDRKFIFSFLIDSAFAGIVSLVYLLVYKLVQWKGQYFDNFTSEEIKEVLVTAAPEEVSAMASHVKTYLITFFGSFLLYTILIIVLFSLGQSLIWHLLLNKKLNKKVFFKWNLFTLVLFIVFSVSFLIFILFKAFVLLLLQGINVTVILTIGHLLNILYLLIVLYLFSLLCYHFTKENRIWLSFSQTFASIKHQIKKLLPSFFLTLAVAIVLSLITIAVFTLLPALINYLIYFNIIIILLFLAWFRIYLVKIVH